MFINKTYKCACAELIAVKQEGQRGILIFSLPCIILLSSYIGELSPREDVNVYGETGTVV